MSPRALACALVAALAAAIGCGARPTFDPYEKVCFQPATLAPRLAGDAEARSVTATAALDRALVHYVRFGGVFKEVRGDCAGADEKTLVVEPLVREYAADEGRPLGFVGGRARGSALIRYAFRTSKGELLAVEELRSFARSGLGKFTDVPEPLGGIDPTIEGAAAEFHWWLRRNKRPK